MILCKNFDIEVLAPDVAFTRFRDDDDFLGNLAAKVAMIGD